MASVRTTWARLQSYEHVLLFCCVCNIAELRARACVSLFVCDCRNIANGLQGYSLRKFGCLSRCEEAEKAYGICTSEVCLAVDRGSFRPYFSQYLSHAQARNTGGACADDF